MQHYDASTDFIVEGIDTLSVDLLNQAVIEMETGGQFIKQATKLMNELNASRSK